METHVERRVQSSARAMFDLVARVEDWPRLLPHYRFVQVLQVATERERTVEMAARRDVVTGQAWTGIPLRWTAVQTLSPEQPRVEFLHVRGPTRGMRVAWTFHDKPDGCAHVLLHHAFDPHWPIPDSLVRLIVGEYFVNGVARRTLAHFAALAERAHAAGR